MGGTTKRTWVRGAEELAEVTTKASDTHAVSGSRIRRNAGHCLAIGVERRLLHSALHSIVEVEGVDHVATSATSHADHARQRAIVAWEVVQQPKCGRVR